MLKKMKYDDFWDKYEPITNDLDDNASYDGCMFETYDEELAFVKKQPKAHIATLIEVNGEQYIISGFHLVNRLGYFITKHPMPEDLEVTVYDDDDIVFQFQVPDDDE